MTRPRESNGLGLQPVDASSLMVAVENVFRLIDDVPGIFKEWKRLTAELGVSGKQVHDANHVAAMSIHGLDSILTLDERDFRRYAWITILKV